MSFEPVSAARTSASCSSSFSHPVEGKYSPTLSPTTLPAATSSAEVFSRTLPVDEANASSSDEVDIEAIVIHTLRKWTLADRSLPPASQVVHAVCLEDYPPSSQCDLACLYKTPRKSRSSLPAPRKNAQSSPPNDSRSLSPLSRTAVESRPKLKRTLSERVSLNPESSGLILDAFSLLRKKHAPSVLQALPEVPGRKKIRPRSDADLDSSQASNPKKLHQPSVRTSAKRLRPPLAALLPSAENTP